MSDVERWLRRQAVREHRGIMLEEALLGDRLWRYTRYRLRYFFAKYLTETAVHTLTVLFLVLELERSQFLPVVAAHTVTSLAASFWWGALEGLRRRVRELYRSGKPHRIAALVAGWLVFAGLLSAVVLALLSGWIVWHLSRGEFGAPQAYVAVLLLRLGVDLPLRCYHSGVYALRRVYKPLPAILGPEVLQLAAILLLWPLVGLWALVIAALLVTVTISGITLHYTGRVYGFIGLAPRPLVRLRALRGSVHGAGREMLLAGGANAAIALDSIVVLALLYGAATSDALVVLFLAAPGIRAGAEWARLFYFDLKRLELRLFTNLRRRFEHHTAVLAWVLGIAFWASTSAITTVAYGRSLGISYLALLAFFLARSLLARVQVQAFASEAYAPVLATGLLLASTVAMAGATVPSEQGRLAAVALLTALAAAVLSRLAGQAARRGEVGAPLLTLEWLRRLGGIDGPVVLGSARVAAAGDPERLDARARDERTRWRLAQLSEQVARRLGERGAAAWVGPDRVVWFEPADGASGVTPEWLQVASGGLIHELLRRKCASGEEALLAAGQESLFGSASAHLLSALLPVDTAAARERFAQLLPDGWVYAPDEPVPQALAALPGSELRAILADAVAFARDLRTTRRRSRFDVTALCAGGELRLIFVADLAAPPRTRRRWRHQLVRLNVRAAVAGTRRHRQQRRLPSVPAAARLPGTRSGHAIATSARGGHGAASLDSLRRVPLLSELDPRQLAQVAAAMSARSFPAGAQLTVQGQAGVGFFVIEDGRAGVWVDGEQVAELGPGDHFGEVALIAEIPRTATVTALTDLRCYRMTSWEFRQLVEENAALSWRVLQSVARLLDDPRRQQRSRPEQVPVAAGSTDGQGGSRTSSTRPPTAPAAG